MYWFFSILGVIAAALTLDQIWFGFIEAEIFWKSLVSIAVIAGLAVGIYLLKNEFVEQRKMKKDKFLD